MDNSHLGSLAEDIRALQDSVHQLTTDIGRFAGSYGITYKMEQLQNSISQLSSKISQVDVSITKIYT
jgi:methyl-accepting chemotaxis protein